LVEKTHKTSFMRSKLYVYDELITLLQSLHLTQPQQGYDRKALEIFERKQGRVFLEEMGKSGAWRFAGVQEKISRKDRELEQQIATTRQKRTEALEQGKDAEQHSKRLTKLIADQQAFEKMLATDYPKYYQLKYPKPASLVTLQQKVLQIGEMMLVYNVMKESTALWVIGKQQFQMFTLPVGGKTLSESVYGEEGLRKLIKERLLEFTEVSHVLYQTLLPKAVRQLIAKADTLYIVPTSILYGLPFEALVTAIADDDIPHYLIQDYAIVYLSSASLLKTLRDERRKKAPQPLLAFANPDYPPCSDGKSKEKRTGKIVANRIVELCPKERNVQKTRNECLLPPLVETEDEVCQIATLFNIPKQAFEKVLYLRKAATRQNLLKLNENGELDNYRYLMFSVHGFLPNEIEFIPQPALAFSMSDVADETGYLTMADAFTLELNADFVNLSACNTGRGTHIQGEGFMS
jgi:CHAT domain-containing protein